MLEPSFTQTVAVKLEIFRNKVKFQSTQLIVSIPISFEYLFIQTLLCDQGGQIGLIFKVLGIKFHYKSSLTFL